MRTASYTVTHASLLLCRTRSTAWIYNGVRIMYGNLGCETYWLDQSLRQRPATLTPSKCHRSLIMFISGMPLIPDYPLVLLITR
ncbi:hypothetical protein BDV39DRAFT_136881 [Aspergillus sergii]|uniref:Uncharacterized protein n=1 Tax=Aspergillus sergii TaxID=1034303 RepID=A0A5N6XI12_9EURO|nr:hypothetical protein BDV39DRAFT_136881 [Aspergillus sergii]